MQESMVYVNDLDKKLLGEKIYKKAIIEAIRECEINLSYTFAKLIGYVGNIEKDVKADHLDGFFYWDTHDDNMKKDVRSKAIEKLRSLVSVAGVKEEEVGEIVGDNIIERYCTAHLSKRKSIRNSTWRVGYDNIENIFVNIIKCNDASCDMTWTMNVINTTRKDEAQWLHLPPDCIKGKFDIVLENIVRHSMCKHDSNGENKQIDLTLQGTSIGIKSRCLYLMIIAVAPNIQWLRKDNGDLEEPTEAEYLENLESFLPYCDYVILAPKDNNYYQYNLASKYNNSEKKNWRKIPRNGDALSEKVRFGSETLYVKHNHDNSKIEFHHTESARMEWECIDIAANEIVHVLVFNNHQKP